MKLHKQIIGICWIVIGSLIISMLIPNTGSVEHPVLGTAISLLFIVAGFMLASNRRYTSWIAMPCAALSLFVFPIGTIVAAYYLWWFFKYDRTRPAGAA